VRTAVAVVGRPVVVVVAAVAAAVARGAVVSLNFSS